MIYTAELGFFDWKDKEGVAKRIVEELSFAGKDSRNLLYRGFGCDDQIWERVLRTGTDRCAELQSKHASLLVASDPSGIDLEDALREKDPSITYLSNLDGLPFSTSLALCSARVDTPYGAISVHDSKGVKRLSPLGSEQDKYRFNGSALDCLIGLFKFNAFKR
jgi:hypothetical protein